MSYRKSVLIADDDPDLLDCLARQFARLEVEVITADTGRAAVEQIYHRLPDLIVLDIGMPLGDGLSVCEMISRDELLQGIPVVILTGRGDPEVIRRCHALRAYYVPKGPGVWERMQPLAAELLDVVPAIAQPGTMERFDQRPEISEQVERAARAIVPLDRLPSVLCIDDDEDCLAGLARRLEAAGFAVKQATDGMSGYRVACSQEIDVIVIDYEMPNGQGDYVLGRLRDNPLSTHVPVVVLTGWHDRALERKMTSLGAELVMTKPVQYEHLCGVLQRLCARTAIIA